MLLVIAIDAETETTTGVWESCWTIDGLLLIVKGDNDPFDCWLLLTDDEEDDDNDDDDDDEDDDDKAEDTVDDELLVMSEQLLLTLLQLGLLLIMTLGILSPIMRSNFPFFIW